MSNKVMVQTVGGGTAVVEHTTVAEMEPVLRPSGISEEMIAERAFSYWEARGSRGGSPEDDWYRALEELIAEQQR